MQSSARGCATFLCCAVLSSGAFAKATPTTTLPEPVAGAAQALAQTPVTRYSEADRERRLAEKGLVAGSPVMIRIFKKESQFELWLQKNGRFEHFETYAICAWSGKLGPKRREGDLQTPEGFYHVDVGQLRLRGRNARSFYINYPNALEKTLGRTGSAIMVHGHCQSIGCYAMTDPAAEEIYALVERALFQGQVQIEVQAFPFRMTDANMAAHASSEWHSYWQNLKTGYDLFEATRLPPIASACGGKYVFDAGVGTQPDIGAPPGPAACELEAPEAEIVAVVAKRNIARVVKAFKARRKNGRRVAGRKARKAYAAARRARMNAYAMRARGTSRE
jgi:murein L,D-transpeptidase YafK